VSYAAKIDKAEAHIDWSLRAEQIERRVRAFDPFPGCSFVVEGETIKPGGRRWSRHRVRPGEVLLQATNCVVACGHKALALLELQRTGRPASAGGRLPAGPAAGTGHACWPDPGPMACAPRRRRHACGSREARAADNDACSAEIPCHAFAHPRPCLLLSSVAGRLRSAGHRIHGHGGGPKREAEGKAIGGACRHAGRAIEDCYVLNKKADKGAVFTGWREMNDYMRENKIEVVAPVLPPPGAAGHGADPGRPGEDEEEAEAPAAATGKKPAKTAH
jgi:hypothetical protein